MLILVFVTAASLSVRQYSCSGQSSFACWLSSSAHRSILPPTFQCSLQLLSTLLYPVSI
ncbi:hypothetical protein BDQ12DRAFT_97631 [Crucibulum laeve]|uniref:Uncharacterized protein n=1 Tax=Crucibulum laeve TaxID=68775 RepID=A0A5C3M006_9AGAR|nr:hypothetical protein BDQ12DRAFT_97631 [Crucibulum laeve]